MYIRKVLIYLGLFTAASVGFAICVVMHHFKNEDAEIATRLDTAKIDTTKNYREVKWYTGSGYPKLEVKDDSAYYFDRISYDLFVNSKSGWKFKDNLKGKPGIFY